MKKLFLLILLFIAACKTTSEELSILEKSSCNLPCWNGIVVGQTTESELLQYLKTSADIDQKSIQNDNHPWAIFDNHIDFTFNQGWLLAPQPKIQVDVDVSDNIVSDIIICGELNTTIGDIVKQIGEPESIISGDGLDGNRNVILINSARGISYWYTTNPPLGELQYEMTPDVQVDCIDLFDPALYEEIMEVGLFSMGHYNAEETLRVMYPWDGYGNIAEKYPPRQP